MVEVTMEGYIEPLFGRRSLAVAGFLTGELVPILISQIPDIDFTVDIGYTKRCNLF
jgi:hypothetical protein